MEMKKKQPKVAKKLWKLLQIVIYMTKIQRIGKNKLILDLQTLLKRTKSVLIDSSYYSALTCRSNDRNMFVSPREYEFSCSNTPAHQHKRKSHYYYRQQQDEEQVNSVRRMLEMLNRREVIEASPLNLPGFGRSPYAVRQLRVTDSPFAAEVGSVGGGCQVDKDCEEFIDKFYKSLSKERRIAAALDQSPSPYHLWAR